jgi:hypothetical protein
MKVNNVELGELLGEVSTCWDNNGVFKSDRVLEIQKDIENHVIKLEQQLKEANEVIEVYADSENDYHVEKYDEKTKRYIMKNIIQVSKLAKEYLNKYKVKE